MGYHLPTVGYSRRDLKSVGGGGGNNGVEEV